MQTRVLSPPGLAIPPGAAALDPAAYAGPPYEAPGYSHGVQVGDTVYVAGQVAFDERGQLVGAGDPVAQADQTWANIARVLAEAGGEVADVVKVTVCLADMAHAAHEMAARTRFLDGAPHPAVTLVQVAALALPELLMEIDAIAVVGTGRARRRDNDEGGAGHGS